LQGFKSQIDPEIVATAGTVVLGVTGNNAFPSPPVDLKALQAAFDDLNIRRSRTGSRRHRRDGAEEQPTRGADRAVTQAGALLLWTPLR